jgi:hypothetical protein
MKSTLKKPYIKDVCIAVLMLHSRKNPSSYLLHYKKITDVLLKTGLIKFKGKDPERSVCSELSRHKEIFFQDCEPGFYQLLDYDLFGNDEYINLIINEIDNIDKESGRLVV